ncbi:hypothetical protein NXW11_24590 [Bacteroides thetaiotaomicron]|nr:hypothetical protein [Bacteroides thetaiotaomicron]MCS2621067.1 hypothetical protein [Bacteroides thetaiotaomicron]
MDKGWAKCKSTKGYDPMAKVICSDMEKVKYDWIFRFSPSISFMQLLYDPNARLEIKVTDRFGNVYTLNY